MREFLLVIGLLIVGGLSLPAFAAEDGSSQSNPPPTDSSDGKNCQSKKEPQTS